MQSGYWVLDADKRPVKTDDALVWGRYFETADRVVAKDEIDGARVSTVFLGIDHNWSDGPPVLFETMIFGGDHDGHQTRSSTWEDAEADHAKACALVRKN